MNVLMGMRLHLERIPEPPGDRDLEMLAGLNM